MPVTIGSQSDVPNTGDPIVSPWYQDTARKLVHTFATAAARDAWSSPPDGAMAYTADTDTLWVYRSSAWQPVLAQTAGQWILAGDIYVRKTSAALFLQDASANTLGQFYANDGPPVAMILATGTGRALRHVVAGSDRLTILSAGTVLVHKLDTNLAVTGVELPTHGGVQSTQSTAATNLYANKTGAAVASGQKYAAFANAGTEVGTITLTAALTGVAYNTSSDGRLKSNERVVDPDEAAAKVEAMRPVHFTYTSDPNNEEQVGFIAQELNDVAPEAVTPGAGEPGDEPDEAGDGGFTPWMTDVSKLVPTLVAAIQGLLARVAALEAAAP